MNKKQMTHNIVWKVLSLVFAIVLWFLVNNIQDPVDTKRINDIKVNILHVDEIENKKKHINYGEVKVVSVFLRGRRKVLNKLNKDNINAYADMREISLTEVIPIHIDEPEGVELLNKSPSSIKVTLENVITMQKDVQIVYSGTPAEGYERGEATLQPNKIEVTGPESFIRKIDAVMVEPNISGATKNVELSTEAKVVDDKRNEITGIDKSQNKVKIQIPIYRVKEVSVKAVSTGQVDAKYKFKGLEITPQKVTIVGPANKIDAINSIDLPPVSISSFTKTEIKKYKLTDLLPNDVKAKNLEEIELKINIESKVEKELKIPVGELSVTNIPKDLRFKYISEDDIVINVRGLKDDIDKVTVDKINAFLNLKDLEKGEQEVEVQFILPYGIELVSEKPKVKIELAEEVTPANAEAVTTFNSNSSSENNENML